MPMRRKVLPFVSLPLASAAAAYFYLTRVLRPEPPSIACPGPPHDWRCGSYQLILSKPSFVVAGALIGVWFAYAVVRLHAEPRRRSFTWQEGLVVAPPLIGITAWIIALHPGFSWIGWGTLRWDEVLLFLLAAVLIRLAIGIASIAEVRGGLTFAIGLPIISSGVGYAFIQVFRAPPVGHSCPGGASVSACEYQPLIGRTGPWMILGCLVGLWLAYAIATNLTNSTRGDLPWMEGVVVLPAIAAVIIWALVVGPQQAGQGDVRIFLIAVALAALVRLLLAVKTVRYEVSELLGKLGMVERTEAAER